MDERLILALTNHATIIQNQSEIEYALQHQHKCTEALKAEVAEFSKVVNEVRDLLAAMRVTAGVFKYLAVVGGALYSAWHGLRAAWKMF